MSIDVENLSFAYGVRRVLEDVSFCVAPGCVTSMLGPNGAGKSTLFRCMLGLLRPAAGSVRMAGQPVYALSPRALSGLAAYIPQAHHLAFGFTVLDMVMMGQTGRLSIFAQPGRQQRTVAMQALGMVGMEAFASRDFLSISGGEQQLVRIARALAQQTRILLLDEPTANLDYGNQVRVWTRIRALAEEGYTVLLSSHDPNHALRYSHAILALHNGRVIARGRPEDVVDAALIQRLYGIRVSVENVRHGSTRVCVPDISIINENEEDAK